MSNWLYYGGLGVAIIGTALTHSSEWLPNIVGGSLIGIACGLCYAAGIFK